MTLAVLRDWRRSLWLWYLAASAFKPGCSWRQGPHQAAQNTRTVFDWRKSTDSESPASVWPDSAGAAVPTRPLGAAWETSGCRVQPASSRRSSSRHAGPFRISLPLWGRAEWGPSKTS